MVNITISFRTGLNSGTVSYNMKEHENGVLLHEVNRTLTHAHSHTATNQTGRTIAQTSVIVSAITGEIQIEVAVLVHGSVVQLKVLPITTTGSFTVEVTHNGRWLTNPPTFLEELSKLDQFTKAQYIPR